MIRGWNDEYGEDVVYSSSIERMNMVEEYKILQRIGRLEPTGKYKFTHMHTQKAVIQFRLRYRTAKGEFLPEDWKKVIRDEVTSDGKGTLLEQIKGYCRNNCAWLHTEDAIEEHALECLASHAYEYWKNFQSLTPSYIL